MIFALDRFYFEKDDNVDGSLLDEKLTSQTMKNEESILLVLNSSDKMNAMYKMREKWIKVWANSFTMTLAVNLPLLGIEGSSCNKVLLKWKIIKEEMR